MYVGGGCCVRFGVGDEFWVWCVMIICLCVLCCFFGVGLVGCLVGLVVILSFGNSVFFFCENCGVRGWVFVLKMVVLIGNRFIGYVVMVYFVVVRLC